MVVMDSTVLLLLLDPNAKPPGDPVTGQPLERHRERVEWLIQTLGQKKIPILIPTPVLSEVLVSIRDTSAVLAHINRTVAFKIQPFDLMAAIEVAHLAGQELRSNQVAGRVETVAKIKYDRQIIAIAKVHNVKTIYSDDRRLAKKAAQNGITVIGTLELPLPPERPQGELPFNASV